jgi:hypothetical protein
MGDPDLPKLTLVFTAHISEEIGEHSIVAWFSPQLWNRQPMAGVSGRLGARRQEQDMSPKLNLFVGVLAFLSLPALSACNTGDGGTTGVNEDMQAAGERRGTDSAGEEGISGEATSGPIQEENQGLPGGAIGAAEEEQGAPDAATMGAGGTGSAAQ